MFVIQLLFGEVGCDGCAVHISGLIPVLVVNSINGDLARSVDLEGAEGVVERVVEGLELTLRQLDSAFERFSVFEISPEVGDKLDPESHQAMTLAPSGEVEPNHICQVIQKGYRLHDRLLCPARVIVAKAPDDDDRDEKPVSGA